MADFNEAIKYVLANEKLYSDRAADKGGPTKYGITQNTATVYFRKPMSIQEMKELSLAEACEIYKKWYWDALHLENIESTPVATAIMDVDVNMGQGASVHLTEAAIASFGLQIPKDNTWTHIIEILNAIDSGAFITAFYEQVKAHYELIVVKNPLQGPNLHGWLNRANKLLTLAEAV